MPKGPDCPHTSAGSWGNSGRGKPVTSPHLPDWANIILKPEVLLVLVRCSHWGTLSEEYAGHFLW